MTKQSPYKLIHIFFRDEKTKLKISLEVKINPEDNKDIKVKMKFLYEFTIKEIDDPLILIFEIVRVERRIIGCGTSGRSGCTPSVGKLSSWSVLYLVRAP